MTVKIEFTGSSRADILAQIIELFPALSYDGPVAAEPKSAGKKAAAGNGGVATGTAVAVAETKSAGASLFDEGEGAEEAKPEREPVTLEELKKSLVAHVAKHGEKATTALMKKVAKADKLSKLDPKFYTPVFDAVSAEL